MIQSAIARLVKLLPAFPIPQALRDEYNRQTDFEIERIRDFLILHYTLNSKPGDLWQYCAGMSIPDSLQDKIEHFRRYGRLIQREFDLFGQASWLAVHIGQFNMPQRVDPLLHHRQANAGEWLAKLRDALRNAAQQLPTHQEFINRFCRAN